MKDGGGHLKTVWFERLAIKLLVVIVGVVAAQGLWAQSLSSTASLSGTVSDPSGARVPKATVNLTNSEKGITRVATAGSAGEFSFALLPAGTYTLETIATGFKTIRQTGIVLHAGDSLTENIQLTIGASEQVTVSESAVRCCKPRTPTSAPRLPSKQVEELPLNLQKCGRPGDAEFLGEQPDPAADIGGGGAEDTADQDMSFLSFGGGFFGTTAFLLDGGWNVAGGWGGVVYVPAVDDTQEFKVTNNSFSAEYGWSTGNVVNMITKSGTSDFHFTLSEYLRNNDLDANTYFRNLSHLPITPRSPQSVRGCRRRPALYSRHLQAARQDLLFCQLRGLAAQQCRHL